MVVKMLKFDTVHGFAGCSMANIVMEFALIPASARPKCLAFSNETRELAKLSILCADNSSINTLEVTNYM